MKVFPQCLDGRIYVKERPDRQVTFSEVARYCHFGDKRHHIIGYASVEEEDNAYTFAAHFAEVEVDTETGIVKVLKMVAAHDVGKAINPAIVEGQIEGALHHGIGYALWEDLIVDATTGETINPSLLGYKIPTALDMPEIHSILVETKEPTGPFGNKSIGESGMVAVAPALGNAVSNILGVRIKDLPLLPEKILEAMGM